MFKLCVFDLDGTLVNSLEDLADSTNYALEKNGFETCPLCEYNHYVGDGVPMLLKRALKQKATEDNVKTLLKDFNAYYDTHYANKTRPYGGICELLEKLSALNIKTAVLSNKPDNFVNIIVKELMPQIKFSFVQGKLEGVPKKPDPTALNNIIGNCDVSKDEVLYIGDSNVDVFTGKNAGVRVCGCVWGFRGREELEKAGADFIAYSPLDILNFIK